MDLLSNEFKKSRAGSISISVLLLCIIVLGVIRVLHVLVIKEAKIEEKDLERRQICQMLADISNCWLKMESDGDVVKDYIFPERRLSPSNKIIRAHVKVARDDLLPGRNLQVAVNIEDDVLCLSEVTLQPPLGRMCDFYNNTLTAGEEIIGYKENADSTVKIVSGQKGVLNKLEVEQYKKWKRYDFLSREEYQEVGFGQGLYYDDSLYGNRVPYIGKAIKGDAFLVIEKDLTIDSNVSMQGRIMCIVGGNIHIGDNVDLDKVLLISKKNLNIGNDCSISGVIVVGGKATIGERLQLKREESVLENFHCAQYLK